MPNSEVMRFLLTRKNHMVQSALARQRGYRAEYRAPWQFEATVAKSLSGLRSK